METRIVEFRTSKEFKRRRREWKTLDVMIRMYCQHHHGAADLCGDCAELSDYARRRLERCVFGDEKPTCANCLVHCYKDDMREKVRMMMRWSGPRMLLRHPVLAITHQVDGRRPAPRLPSNPKA